MLSGEIDLKITIIVIIIIMTLQWRYAILVVNFEIKRYEN